MIIWNFKNPLTFFACCIWNLSEYSGLSLPNKIVPILFGLVIGRKEKGK